MKESVWHDVRWDGVMRWEWAVGVRDRASAAGTLPSYLLHEYEGMRRWEMEAAPVRKQHERHQTMIICSAWRWYSE